VVPCCLLRTWEVGPGGVRACEAAEEEGEHEGAAPLGECRHSQQRPLCRPLPTSTISCQSQALFQVLKKEEVVTGRIPSQPHDPLWVAY